MANEQQIIGIIEAVSLGPAGTKQDGTPYQKYNIRMNGMNYGTFDKTTYDQAQQFWTAQQTVTMLVSQKGMFWNVKSIIPAPSGAVQTPQPATPVTASPPPYTPPADPKMAYWKNKEVIDAERDTRISRHGALNTAVNIYQMTVGGSGIQASQILKECEDMAEQILQWLTGGPQ